MTAKCRQKKGDEKMNELIKIGHNAMISTRDLYEFLELNPAHYARWCRTNIEEDEFYQHIEGR